MAAEQTHRDPFKRASDSDNDPKERAELRNPEEQKGLGASNQSFFKVEAGRVDSIIDMAGELVVIKNQICTHPLIVNVNDGSLASLISLFNRSIRDLYESTLTIRMEPLKPLFSKLKSAIESLAPKLGKAVEVQISGEETELDRMIVEKLEYPLIHLCRNAVDHGIENSQDRMIRRKPEAGLIKLSARRRGTHVVIEISDDGMGIQRDRIIHKALERGLLTQNDLAGGISDEGLFDLLFLDGFSTTPIINEISGRGVGLNVVRSVVHSLKGKVTTESLAGEGTSFCISLPVTTAITDGFVVSYAGQQYILPAENIKEFFAFEQLELIQVENRGQMIKIRDEFVTFLSLGDLVGSCSQQKGLIVLVEYDKKTWALRVDEVIGKSQIVMKGINELLGDTYGIIGTAVLGNGKIGFVIDIGDMIAASVAKGTSLPK